MRPNQRPQREKAPAFCHAGNLLSKSSAIALTFFGTGPAFSASQSSVAEFVSGAYGAELIGITSVIWFILLAVVIYAFSTLLVAALIQIGSLKGATSLLKRH